MTPVQIDLVRTSFARLAPQAEQVGMAFYANLFRRNPGVRPLFPAEIAGQSRKLMTMLSSIVATLDHPQRLEVMVRTLGQRHAGYAVEAAHYAQVGAALIETLREGVGADFDADLEAAWVAAYGFLSSRMLAAQRDMPSAA